MEKQFGYKAWANAEMFEALATIDPQQHPAQWKRAVRLMNHAYVVDRIFAAHLQGTAHGYQATNTPDTPILEALREDVAASDAWYRQYVATLEAGALHAPVSFSFTDGEAGTMTRAEILFHVLAHGAYHRGNVGMVLAECGCDRPSDTFTRYLHASEPGRRQGIV